jgi:hypothetical protein
LQELLPLVVQVDVPVLGGSLPDPASPALKHIQDAYNVTISLKQGASGAARGAGGRLVASLVVRGTVDNAAGVKQATGAVLHSVLAAGRVNANHGSVVSYSRVHNLIS